MAKRHYQEIFIWNICDVVYFLLYLNFSRLGASKWRHSEMQFYILLLEATSPPVDGALGQRLVQRAATIKIGPVAQRSSCNNVFWRTDVYDARLYFWGLVEIMRQLLKDPLHNWSLAQIFQQWGQEIWICSNLSFGYLRISYTGNIKSCERGTPSEKSFLKKKKTTKNCIYMCRQMVVIAAGFHIKGTCMWVKWVWRWKQYSS